jgi:hypothetical protein
MYQLKDKWLDDAVVSGVVGENQVLQTEYKVDYSTISSLVYQLCSSFGSNAYN